MYCHCPISSSGNLKVTGKAPIYISALLNVLFLTARSFCLVVTYKVKHTNPKNSDPRSRAHAFRLAATKAFHKCSTQNSQVVDVFCSPNFTIYTPRTIFAYTVGGLFVAKTSTN